MQDFAASSSPLLPPVIPHEVINSAIPIAAKAALGAE
jgi:hypothetical protein